MTALISIQATLNNSANNFVVSWELASGGGIINSIAPAKPYGDPWQVSIPSLTANVVYIIKLWESTSTSPAGTLRNSTNYIPTATTTTLRADDYLTTDVTSGLVNGTTAYSNTSYAGWGYDVERIGQGTMFLQGAPNVSNPDYAQDTAGGFHFVRSGDAFQPNERFVVRFQPMVAPAEAANTGVITTGEIITASGTLTSADLNKAIFIQGAAAYLIITLPPLSSVSDYQFMYFYSAGGSHITAIINANGTDGILRNIAIGTIVLGQMEQLKIFKANGLWNVDYVSPGVDLVGEFVFRTNGTGVNQYGRNTVFADGSLLDRNTYWRLFQYLQNSGITPVSEVAWNAGTVIDGVTFYLAKGNWTMGNSSASFRIPDMRDFFLRATSASVGFGIGAFDTMLLHKHPTQTGLLPGGPDGESPNAGNNGRYYNIQNQKADLTDLPTNDPGAGGTAAFLTRVGTETAPKHTRVPILIRS